MSTDSKGAKVFLGVPHNGVLCAETVQAYMDARKPNSNTHILRYMKESSALTFNFNILFASALNARKTDGVTHFAMLHADVAPDAGWLDVLLEELTAHNAGVVSCVIPIKSQLGLTTTAIGRPKEVAVIKRLTVRECRRLPQTFTAADAGYPDNPLLINTGCWICDLRQPWVDEFTGFTIVDDLDRKSSPGNAIARFFSEDWWFGLWLHMHGVKVMATTAVGVMHKGWANYRNDHDWGLEMDPGDGQQEVNEAIRKTREASAKPAETIPLAPLPKKTVSREIVAVRYAENMAWVQGWLDDLLVKHGPDLSYRIYDKGPGGDTPNIGHLDWTYLHHIVNRWDHLADWTIFTQADPFPHLIMEGGHEVPFSGLLNRRIGEDATFPFWVKCREWKEDGRIDWQGDLYREKMPKWYHAYRNGTIRPAKLSLREWFAEYLGLDIDQMGYLEYHPGAIFAASREMIHSRPKAFYERLLANLGESGHPAPEEAHFMERAWTYVFRK